MPTNVYDPLENFEICHNIFCWEFFEIFFIFSAFIGLENDFLTSLTVWFTKRLSSGSILICLDTKNMLVPQNLTS